MATAVFNKQVFPLRSTLSGGGWATVVNEPDWMVLLEVVVGCVAGIVGWEGGDTGVALFVGDSLQILVWCLRVHLRHRYLELQLETLWWPKQLKHNFSCLMMVSSEHGDHLCHVKVYLQV